MKNARSIIHFVSRLILGGVFIWASLDKLVNPEQFAELVFNYKILPTQLVNITAVILPWVELVAGIILISGRYTFSSSFILTGLVLLFAVVLTYNLARGLNFQCGCFSTSAEARNTGIMTLVRDLALLPPALFCFWGPGKAARTV